MAFDQDLWIGSRLCHLIRAALILLECLGSLLGDCHDLPTRDSPHRSKHCGDANYGPTNILLQP